MNTDPLEASALGERLRALRKSHGAAIGRPDLPAAHFAALAGIEPAAYLAMEAGDREPSLAALAALRRLTGVSLDWLIEGDQPRDAPASAARGVSADAA
jgi:transcriptional regulator with XRE-family HTH domain